MDISSLASSFSSMQAASLQTKVSTSVLDKAMDTQKVQFDQLLEGFDVGSASVGEVGYNLDLYA